MDIMITKWEEMMSSFAITTPATNVALSPTKVGQGATASGTASYSVTNQTGGVVRARLRIDTDDGAEAAWFAVREGSEQNIGPGSTAVFSIDLSVPGAAEAQSKSFKAVAVNLADPDNDFAVGSAIAFEQPSLEGDASSGLQWWMIAIPVGLLVLVGAGLGLFFLMQPSGVAYKDYTDRELAASLTELGGLGLTVAESRDPESRVSFGNLNPERNSRAQKFFEKVITSQLPLVDESGHVPEGTSVQLFWKWKPLMVEVPNVVGQQLAPAIKKMASSGLNPRLASLRQGAIPTGVVSKVTPTGEVAAGTTVTLSQRVIPGAVIQPDLIRRPTGVRPELVR